MTAPVAPPAPDLRQAIGEAEGALKESAERDPKWQVAPKCPCIHCVSSRLLAASRAAQARIRELESRANAREEEVKAHMEFRYRAERERDRMRGLLDSYQWSVPTEIMGLGGPELYSACPECDQIRDRGHAPDCRIGMALAPAAKEENRG